jgi:hypothetical protein
MSHTSTTALLLTENYSNKFFTYISNCCYAPQQHLHLRRRRRMRRRKRRRMSRGRRKRRRKRKKEKSNLNCINKDAALRCKD